MSAPTAELPRSLFSSLSQYLLPHSWVLAAGAVGAVLVKQPKLAKVLGAVALADVAGRQLSPEWAALVAGWYPTESVEAAAVVEPLRTVEEVRARGIKTVNAVATRVDPFQTYKTSPGCVEPGCAALKAAHERAKRVCGARGWQYGPEVIGSGTYEQCKAERKNFFNASGVYSRLTLTGATGPALIVGGVNFGSSVQQSDVMFRSQPMLQPLMDTAHFNEYMVKEPIVYQGDIQPQPTVDELRARGVIPTGIRLQGLRPPSRAALAGLLMR